MSLKRKFLTKLAYTILTMSVTFASAATIANLTKTTAGSISLAVSSPFAGQFGGVSAENVTFTYIADSEFINGSTLNVRVSHPTLVLPGALTNCTSATTDIDGDTTADGSFGSFTTTGATYTFTAATTDATTTGATFCLRFPANTPQGSYSVTIITSTGDFGGALLYVAQDNNVLVTAEVDTEISFNIRNAADTADTNVCQIGLVGTISTAAVGATRTAPAQAQECAYSLAIGTSSLNGFIGFMQANNQMTNGIHNIAPITNGGSFVAGTEAYGIVEVFPALTGHDGAGNFDQTLTLSSDAGFTFLANNATTSTPVPVASAQNIVFFTDTVEYVAGVDNDDVTVVVHGMNAGTATPGGLYSQTVSYFVTPQF